MAFAGICAGGCSADDGISRSFAILITKSSVLNVGASRVDASHSGSGGLAGLAGRGRDGSLILLGQRTMASFGCLVDKLGR